MGSRVCQLLGCEYPVVEGGLAYVGNGSLAAAVSEGGGFGQIGSGGRSIDDFATQIEIAIQQTTKPIGVNIPISEHRDYTGYLNVVKKYAKQLRAVSLSAGNPRPLIQPLHDLGLVVMTLASTPEQAKKAELAGADLVVCEGTEAGGHDGPAELSTMTLIPLVRKEVTVPIIAAGGIANGVSAAAAFCLGADGVQLGTRFVATVECQAHDAYKQALVAANASDTRVIERSLGRVTRVLKSEYVEQILEQERKTPGDLSTLLPMISGKMNAVAALQGQMENGWVNCGTSVGGIHNIPSARTLVRDLMFEAKQCMETTSQYFC